MFRASHASPSPRLICRAALAAAGFTLSAVVGAQGMMYGSGSAEPGLTLGYARPVTNSLVVRADATSSGAPRRVHKGSAVEYAGTLRFDRMAMLADYYLWRQLRVTGGLMVSQVTLASSDPRIELRLKAPEVSSYMGLGFGNAASDQMGWNVYGDLGWSLGKAAGKQAVAQLPGGSTDVGDKNNPQSPAAVPKLSIAPSLKLGANLKF